MDKITYYLTGCAGFIGSNILEELLKLGHKVIGVDNFSTGSRENLTSIENSLKPKLWKNFTFYKIDIRCYEKVLDSMKDCTHVIHQAALGSVPRSIKTPLETNENNVTGTLNIFNAAKENEIKRVVYASSSSVYGDSPDLPKVENNIGNSLSPYATSKRCNEVYAESFSSVYGTQFVGLRYFNVFGRRQSPNGAYAAVIPKWIQSILDNETVTINGDGKTSRDFTYIDNIVQLNIKSSLCSLKKANTVLNGACGESISLNELLKELIKLANPSFENYEHIDFRAGDIRHSLADISLAKETVGYEPTENVFEGLKKSMNWYKENLR